MKRYLTILAVLIFQSYICTAQTNHPVHNSRIEKLKVEFMTQKLQLNPTESKAFWPVYNAYYKQIRTTWQKCEGNRPLFEEKAAIIKDKYRKPFVKILHSHERANNVYKVEKAYWAMLRRELKERGKR